MQRTPNFDRIRRCLRRPIPWRKAFVFLIRFGLILISISYFQSLYYDPEFELAMYLRSNASHVAPLTLIHHSQYQPRRCTPVTPSNEKEELKLARSLILTAETNKLGTLTAAHVNRKSCLLVTREHNGDDNFTIMLNPRSNRATSPIKVRETSLLCRDPIIKTIAQNVSIYYTNGSLGEQRTQHDCTTLACAFALSHAIEVLNGQFKCQE